MKISISVIFPKWYHSGSDTLYEPPCLFLTTQTSPQTLFTSLFLSSFASYIRLLFTHTCPVTEFAVASHLNTANSCCHHVFLRHFRFQKCLSVNSYGKMPLAFILSLQALPCKNRFIILIILLQKLRRIQTIRAHRLAVSAVQAVLYLLHLRLSLRGEVSR